MFIQKGKMVSHYRIIEKLGSGGMGVVYKAEDTKLQRTVALKFLPPELTSNDEVRRRFVHEARAASAIDHQNIGTIYEINESGDELFIVMAYYGDTTLKDKIGPDGSKMDTEEALDITIQIARGLKAAHAKNIVHRDIKPANILITKNGQIKIIDFGLAKLKGQTILTKSGSTMGTAAYMSPEQARGGAADERSDIWSVGVMLYEMLAGEKPFKGEYEQGLLYLIINEEPEFITKLRKDIPLQIEKILQKALAKNPDKRYQTMEEFLQDLIKAEKDLKEGQTKTSFIFKLGRKRRRIAYRSIVIILLAAILGFYLWKTNEAKAAPVSIALLPLQNISNDSNQGWFAEGMTDALITDLAKISKFRITSLASVLQYKDTKKTTKEIAKELGVQYVIEGSILKMGEKVKISARLINGPKDEYVWAEEYERDLSSILGLQGEIARNIANKIAVKLKPQEKTRLTVTRTINPATYELYLKGMYFLNKYTPAGIATGLAYLQEAVDKDPQEPLAYAGLALGYSVVSHTPSPPPNAITRSKEAALKALEMDESFADAHLALAMVKIYHEWDRKGAEKEYKRALELNPSLAEAYNQYGWYLLLIGKKKEAVASLKKAEQVSPLAPNYPGWLGMMYNWLEQPDKAIIEGNKSVELVPDFPIGLYVLGDAYATKGKFEKAIACHKKLGEMSMDWKWNIGHTYARAGRREEALKIAAELESQPKEWYTWGLAEIYTALGDKDKAFYWLEEALKQRHPYIQWIKRNVSLNPLQSDPRFEALLKKMNL